jgi:hypothetical protein
MPGKGWFRSTVVIQSDSDQNLGGGIGEASVAGKPTLIYELKMATLIQYFLMS